LAVIALGLGAGYTAAKNSNSTRDQRIGRGATAGAIAGLIALVGTAIAVAGISQLPFMQAQVQAGINEALQQNPELSGSGIDPAAFAQIAAGAGGIIGGICGGIINFLTMLLCGLLGALFWKGSPNMGGYIAAGAGQYNAPPAGSYIPSQNYGNQSYGNQPTNPSYDAQAGHGSSEGGARVYDPNDPNRPQ
jgi:hypothetical protein